MAGVRRAPSRPAADAPRTAWFTAFAPYDRPELAIAAAVDGGTGADRAVTAGAEVLRRYFELER